MSLFNRARAAALAAAASLAGAGIVVAAAGAGVAGTWQATLASPGGELPFGLIIEAGPGGALIASALNGPEKVPFSSVKIDGRSIALRFDQYDSEIDAAITADGSAMRGTWTKQAGKDRPVMTFAATRAPAASQAWRDDGNAALPRFGPRPKPAGSSPVRDVTGSWDVVFKDPDGESPARAELRQEGSRLLGTFLTPTGDYRYLEGDYGDGVLRLSCFDGGHAFLFIARAGNDGTIAGDFWSRGSYHATWKASRARDAGGPGSMPDPFGMTSLKNPSGRLSFSFPDLDGRAVSLSDPRFKGKVVLVDIFGSWCPNCNDQAPVLEDLYARYHPRGLEIVGLAYEMTGEPARDAIFVRKYAERHNVAYPLLLAGTSDKTEASATLPDLSGVLAFPTLIFVGRDGTVKAIHTGFAGPGTGDHFTELRARYVSLIESLLGS
jgi:thiol-disulfide isomerase/thioredoxin